MRCQIVPRKIILIKVSEQFGSDTFIKIIPRNILTATHTGVHKQINTSKLFRYVFKNISKQSEQFGSELFRNILKIYRNNLDVFICLCLHLQNCTETRQKRSSLKDCVVEKQIKSPTFLNKNRKDKSFFTKRSYQTSLTMTV